MNNLARQDELDDGFAAEDEFATATTAWAEESLSEDVHPYDDGSFHDAGLEDLASEARPESSGSRRRPLAGVTVHVFCATPAFTEAAQRAKLDRRLQRLTLSLASGGLPAAIRHYQNTPTPSLVIVESQDGADELLGQLDQLAEVFDPGSKLIVIGRENDIALYRQVMGRGISDYLVPPLDPNALIAAISGLYQDPNARPAGRSIAFVGARGGVGASTVAHNFAHTLAEALQSTAVIVDFDLAFGTAGLDFNQDPLQGVADALSQPDRLDPVLLERMMVRCSDRLALFAAPANLDDVYDIAPDVFEDVIEQIKTTAAYAILDMPHLWAGWTRRALAGADEVVLVATPDATSVRNARNILAQISAARPNDRSPRLVLNQVGVKDRPEIPAAAFAEALGIAPDLIIPFEPKLFGHAANNGLMIQNVQPASKIVHNLQVFAQEITGREAPAAKKATLLRSLRQTAGKQASK